MHAVVGKVSIQAGREDDAQEFLKTNVVPMVKQAPALISGYWLAPQGGHGMGITFFESEEAARAGAEMAKNAPRPDYVTIDSIEVIEVVAQV